MFERRPREPVFGTALPYFQTMAGRRLRRQIILVLIAFGLGYLPTMWLFPAPLFSTDRSVPRVLDFEVTKARRTLQDHGFRATVAEERADPKAPNGVVTWQDPVPGTVAPPNTQVALTLSSGPADVAVPDLVGFPGPLAAKVIRAGGFAEGRSDTVPSSAEAGVVVSTRPSAGVGRPTGTPIDVVISSGPAEISVPNLAGLTVQQAREQIEGAGLQFGSTTRRNAAGRPEGVVIEQHPGGGTRAARGTRVDLVLSRKPL